MTPYWSSLADFLAMHGHGPYVWGAFGMCALLVAGECVQLARARRASRMQSVRSVRSVRSMPQGDLHEDRS